MASTKQIEEYLQKIRRLPSNKVCANCRAQSRLGFSAVCVKYQSFVCDLCKSAHQSFSHRTKSVTMSTWTMDEVKALDEKNGGGNDWCRARWLARLTDSEIQRWVPKEGDPLDNYKRFVHMAYEESKWYDANARPSSSSTGSSIAPSLMKAASEPTTSVSKPSVVMKKTAPSIASTSKSTPAQKKAADEDLLSLDFNATVTITSAPNPPPVSASTSKSVFDDDWSSFVQPTSAQKPNQQPKAEANVDDWVFNSATPLQPTPSNNGLNAQNLAQLYQPQAPQMVPTGLDGFHGRAPVNRPALDDPFALLHTPSPPTMQPPHMPPSMPRSVSSMTYVNPAPTVVSGFGGIQRSASAPASNLNDPFAGLI